MNIYFRNLAANLINKEYTKSNLTSLLNNLPDENYDQSFHLNHTKYIHVRYLKPVADYITLPMVHIVNTSIN